MLSKKKLLRRAAAESYLRPISISHKVFPFPIETCCGVVEYFRMSYRPSVETSHSSIVSLHPTRVSVYRFPLSVYRGLSPAFRVYLQQSRRPGRIEESRHDRRSRPKSSDEVRAVAQHVKFGLKKLGGHGSVYRAHWVSRQKCPCCTRGIH